MKPSPLLATWCTVNIGEPERQSASEVLHSCKIDTQLEDELLPLGV